MRFMTFKLDKQIFNKIIALIIANLNTFFVILLQFYVKKFDLGVTNSVVKFISSLISYILNFIWFVIIYVDKYYVIGKILGDTGNQNNVENSLSSF